MKNRVLCFANAGGVNEYPYGCVQKYNEDRHPMMGGIFNQHFLGSEVTKKPRL